MSLRSVLYPSAPHARWALLTLQSGGKSLYTLGAKLISILFLRPASVFPVFLSCPLRSVGTVALSLGRLVYPAVFYACLSSLSQG